MVLNVTLGEIMEIILQEDNRINTKNMKGNMCMKYQLVKQIKDNDVLRESFIALAIEVFD